MKSHIITLETLEEYGEISVKYSILFYRILYNFAIYRTNYCLGYEVLEVTPKTVKILFVSVAVEKKEPEKGKVERWADFRIHLVEVRHTSDSENYADIISEHHCFVPYFRETQTHFENIITGIGVKIPYPENVGELARSTQFTPLVTALANYGSLTLQPTDRKRQRRVVLTLSQNTGYEDTYKDLPSVFTFDWTDPGQATLSPVPSE